MSGRRWRISVTAPDWGQDHLSSDAIVAYVDDELANGPHLRATQHLAQCRECAVQVVAQGQARAALRTAGCPSMPTSLLSSLRSIPQDTDLPAPPAGLSMTADGQFVSVLRPEPVEPESHLADEVQSHRALRLGAGVAVSGLAIGAIAFALPTAPDSQFAAVPTSGDVRDGVVSPVDARLQLAPAPQAVPTVTPAAPVGGAAAAGAGSTSPAPSTAPVPDGEAGESAAGRLPGAYPAR